jgi:hypothetical protein
MNGQRRRRGRPSKGERDLVKGEVPVLLAQRFKSDAKKRGISQADLLAELLGMVYDGGSVTPHGPSAQEGAAMQQAS